MKKYNITIIRKKNEYQNEYVYVYNLNYKKEIIQSITLINWSQNCWEIIIPYVNKQTYLEYLWKEFLRQNNCKRCISTRIIKQLKPLGFKKQGNKLIWRQDTSKRPEWTNYNFTQKLI